MSAKIVWPREVAEADVNHAINYYLDQAGEKVALGLIDEVQRAYSHIGKHPASGSTRYAHELDIPGLRSWTLNKYPYIVFYVEKPEFVDVWRVLHMDVDIPEWLSRPHE